MKVSRAQVALVCSWLCLAAALAICATVRPLYGVVALLFVVALRVPFFDPWVAFDQFKAERPWFVYATVGLAAGSGVAIAALTTWSNAITQTPRLWLVPFSFLLILAVVHEIWIYRRLSG